MSPPQILCKPVEKSDCGNPGRSFALDFEFPECAGAFAGDDCMRFESKALLVMILYSRGLLPIY